MKRTAYQPPDVFAPAGKTYSHGIIVEAGRTLYVAGQTSRDNQGNVVCKGDAAGQTRQVLENMKKVIEGAGGRMEDVAKTTVYITDIKHREAVGRVRQDRLFDLKLEALVHNTVRGAAGAAILNAELLQAGGLLP